MAKYTIHSVHTIVSVSCGAVVCGRPTCCCSDEAVPVTGKKTPPRGSRQPREPDHLGSPTVRPRCRFRRLGAGSPPATVTWECDIWSLVEHVRSRRSTRASCGSREVLPGDFSYTCRGVEPRLSQAAARRLGSRQSGPSLSRYTHGTHGFTQAHGRHTDDRTTNPTRT